MRIEQRSNRAMPFIGTLVVGLAGCFTSMKPAPKNDGSVSEVSGNDQGGFDLGSKDSSAATIADSGGVFGYGGAGIEASISTGGYGSGGTSGNGGVGADVSNGYGGRGVDAPVSTGGQGSGGTTASGGVGADAPITCDSGFHDCNGKCVDNFALETCGPTECTNACRKPVGGTVSCNGTACVPGCPTTTPQNCDGTCIVQDAPCAGKCTGGQKYCSNSNKCINPTGCCAAADCPAGGANTVPTCTNNVCGIACSSATYTMCGNSCSDLGSDANNCRACSNKCGISTPKCFSAVCVECISTPDCSGSKVCSGNQCICPNNDGACGATCTPCSGSTPRCSGGTCVQCLTTTDCSGNKLCLGNQCKAPLACGDTLPEVTFPTVYVLSGTPSVPAGGTIAEGMYALTKVTCYSSNYGSVSGDSFQLQNGAFHRRHTTYSVSGSAMTGYEEIGTYAASGAAMALDVTKCGTSLGAQSLWKYTASATQIETFTGSAGDTCIQTFVLQQ
jgi:hypothetical protein